ncbi:MAG TPA: glycoside hydrolase family 3 C-terminal domain-containing protein [Burkholderiaceae bacterium]
MRCIPVARPCRDATFGRAIRWAAAWAICLGVSVGAGAASSVRSAADAQAAALVGRMTLDEKLGQLVNVAPPIERLGIPAYNWWTESLHGAIGPLPTTNFPEPIGLAATFDAPLVRQVAAAISAEVRALHALGPGGVGLDTWAPNINIFRDPRWGRGQETYGEDPWLTARLGVAFISGMQGPDAERPEVVATPKHFAVHSGPESTRHSANVLVTPHDLEDTYLPAFRAAIVEGRAGSVMCAYNRVNGQPACANEPLLQQRLRGAWGFEGYVVSDCDAVKDIAEGHRYAPDAVAAVAAAMKSGVDNECNTSAWSGAAALRQRYKDARDRGLISDGDIDRALVRLFSARLRTGDLPGLAPRVPVPASELGAPSHRALALSSAVESLVLLKNDGVLPLQRGVRIALIGPHGDSTRVLRGNYSSERTLAAESLLEGLRRSMPGSSVVHVPFTASITDGDPVPASALRTPEGRPGIAAEYFNATDDGGFAATPAATRVEPQVVSNAALAQGVGGRHKVVWTGFLVPPESGRYRIAMTGVKGSLAVDGTVVRAADYSGWNEPLKFTDVVLEQGHPYALRLEAESGGVAPGLHWKRVSTDLDAQVKAAVAQSDVVVAAVGLTSDIEGEEMPLSIDGFAGGDRTTLDLPADQRRLLESAQALGKPLVVVLMSGSAIDLSWAKAHAAAIVVAWYPGEAGGSAIADVLAGRADPGGRLPVTFYRSVEDLPPFDDYSMKGRTYRYFGGTPVYPFGHGLSYARFAFSRLRIQPVGGRAERGLRVQVMIRNTSARAGDEVVQLYVTPPAFDGAPKHALRGAMHVRLKAGEARALTFHLVPRDLSFVRSTGERWISLGRHRLSVGAGQPDGDAATLSASYRVRADVRLPE